MLSALQQRVFGLKRDGLSYSEILEREDKLTCNRQISCCLRRTALGLPWDVTTTKGADPYLIPEDEGHLSSFIAENAADFDCLTTWQVQECAHALKISRREHAVRELLSMDCEQLASKVAQKPLNPPSRAWVNDFCARNGLRLAKRREIEAARLKVGFFDDLCLFLRQLDSELADTPASLIFNADETMLSGKRQYKGVVPMEAQVAIGPESQDRQHMTAMVTVSASGAKVPLFLILSGLQNLSDSLSFARERCWIATSANGWMTKYLFLDYVINFCHWLSFYRMSLPSDIRSKTAVLILDGHSTRMNPGALEYLKRFNVKVVTLPAHTTHILQPFDVGLAGAFKSTFKKAMIRLSAGVEAGRDALRTATVAAAIDAHDATMTLLRSRAAFSRACIVPCHPEPLQANPYVRPGSSGMRPPNRGFPVNARVLTNDIQAIFEWLRDKRRLDDPTMMIIDAQVQHRCSRERSIHEGRLLTAYHVLLRTEPACEIVDFV